MSSFSLTWHDSSLKFPFLVQNFSWTCNFIHIYYYYHLLYTTTIIIIINTCRSTDDNSGSSGDYGLSLNSRVYLEVQLTSLLYEEEKCSENNMITCVFFNWWKLWIFKLYACQRIICFNILTQLRRFSLTSAYHDTESVPPSSFRKKLNKQMGLSWNVNQQEPSCCWQVVNFASDPTRT